MDAQTSMQRVYAAAIRSEFQGRNKFGVRSTTRKFAGKWVRADIRTLRCLRAWGL